MTWASLWAGMTTRSLERRSPRGGGGGLRHPNRASTRL